jgi:hypothetical protein
VTRPDPDSEAPLPAELEEPAVLATSGGLNIRWHAANQPTRTWARKKDSVTLSTITWASQYDLEAEVEAAAPPAADPEQLEVRRNLRPRKARDLDST